MCESGEEADELAENEPYIVAVDIGTTSLRSHIYNKHGAIKGTSSKKIIIMHPQPGWVEMDPQVLYQQTVDCIAESVKAAGLRMKDVTCLGISTQRNTCLTWDSETGKPYHNFISWQDMRASDSVQSWNNSYSLRAKKNYKISVQYLEALAIAQCPAAANIFSDQWVDNSKPTWDEQLGAQRGCCGSIGVRSTRNPWLDAPAAAI